MSHQVTVTENGQRIVLDFATLGDALQLWKPWSDGKRRSEITGHLHEALNAIGLTLELRVQGRPVALIGGDRMSGLVLQLLGAHA